MIRGISALLFEFTEESHYQLFLDILLIDPEDGDIPRLEEFKAFYEHAVRQREIKVQTDA